MEILVLILAMIGYGSLLAIFQGKEINQNIGKIFSFVIIGAIIFFILEIIIVIITTWGLEQPKIAENSKFAMGVFLLPLTAQFWIYHEFREKINFSYLSLSIELLMIFQAILVYLSSDANISRLGVFIQKQLEFLPNNTIAGAFIFLLISLFLVKVFEKVVNHDSLLNENKKG